MIWLYVLLVTIAESKKIQHLMQGSMPTIQLRISLMINAELVKFQQSIRVLELIIWLNLLLIIVVKSIKIHQLVHMQTS
jgi:hypothetical protein